MARKRNDTTTDVLVAIATLETKVDTMGVDIKEIKDGVKSDVEFLKVDKLGRSEAVRMQVESQEVHNDHETRLRFIERYMWMAIGVLTVLEIGLQIWSNLH